MIIVDPRTIGAKCGECPFSSSGCAVKPVPPEHTPKEDRIGILIGEGPGRHEVESGRPFSGPTGDALAKELLEAGLSRSRLIVANATMCQPQGDKSEAVMKKAVDCCRPAIDHILAGWLHNSKIPILAMGKWAGYYVSKKILGAEKARGFIRQQGNHDWILTWHPTYAIFYNPFEWGAFTADVRKFARLVNWKRIPPPELYTIAGDGEQKVLDILHSMETGHEYIGADIETGAESKEKPWTGKDPTRAMLKTIGLGTTNIGVSFGSPWSLKLDAAVKSVLKRMHTIWHNGPWFDHRVLARYRFYPDAWSDTRDMRRALSASSRLSLGYLATLYDDCGPWKEDEESDDAKGMAFTEDMQALQYYNAQDAVETARIFQGMREAVFTDDRIYKLYHYHRHLSQIAAGMHTHGFYMDPRARKEIGGELTMLSDVRKREFAVVIGIPSIAPTPNNIRALLFKRYQGSLPCAQISDPTGDDAWTETGLIKVDQPNLLNVLIDPAVDMKTKKLIEAYWKATAPQKAYSTFVYGKKIDEATGDDGRVRASWNSCGTDRGRFSCSEPNLQNLQEAKSEEQGSLSGDLPNVRRLYCAAPGHVLVHADYSQLELNVRAAITKDEVLEQHLKSGDVYSMNARDWFKLPPDMDVKKLKPAARKACKIIHLASQYAAGLGKIYVQALKQDRTFSYALAKELHAGFLTTYSRTVEWWKEETERCKKTGYLESRILHRRLVFPKAPEITDVANYAIAATAAEIAGMALCAMDYTLPGLAKILTHEHDAFTVECPESLADEVVGIMRKVMEAPVLVEGVNRSFKTEIKVGPSWDKV